MPPRIELTGRKFGRLLVLGYSHTPTASPYWLCRCDCGTEKSIDGSVLRNGTVISCGCYARERVTRHGKCGTPEHMVWSAMLSRCRNKGCTGFARYGGRGISVCERWRKSFAAFLEDMGPRPSAGHSIERIDNDGNYKPGNCRWATRGEQNRNQSANAFITIAGRTQCLTDWCREYGVNIPTACTRIKKGWDPARAVSTRENTGRHVISIDGVSKYLSEWCRQSGVPVARACARMSRGWTERDAVLIPCYPPGIWRCSRKGKSRKR